MKTLSLIAVVLVTGCATVPHEPLTACASVGRDIRVRIEPGTLLTCDQAEAVTARALAVVRSQGIIEPSNWTVRYTYKFVGLQETGRQLGAVTHPASREILVRVFYEDHVQHSPAIVLHELLHASEADSGHANADHVGWCARGWAALERHFAGHVAFNCN